MDKHSHSMKTYLKDGRQLAYSEYGEPDGNPIFFFHGWPGARLQGALADSAARSLGVRYIAPDRPGFGASDFQPGRCILDWPEDITELADQLEIDRFAVLGLSGGAPYALACAYKIPEMLTAAGIISGIGPIDVPGAAEGVSPALRRLIRLTKMTPWLVSVLLWRSARSSRRNPEAAFTKLLSSLPEPDQEALSQPGMKEMALTARANSFLPGIRGHVLEIGLFARPWGFRREEIQMPIHLWHGEEDQEIYPITAHKQAEGIPNCRGTFLPKEGHYSLYICRVEEILKEMILETSNTAF